MGPFLKLFGFALLGIILAESDTKAFAAHLAQTEGWLFAAALGLGLLSLGVKAYRWKRMLAVQGMIYPLPRASATYLSGFYLGLATPGRLGELAKALFITRDFEVSIGKALASVIVDLLLDLTALCAAGLAAGYVFALLGPISALFLLAALAMALVPFAMLDTRFRQWFVRRLLRPAVRNRFGRWLAEGTEDFFDGLEQLVAPNFANWWILTVLAYALFFACGYLLAEALAIPLHPLATVVALAVANLLSLMPITVAGVGLRDLWFLVAFAALGLSAPAALALSALVLVALYLVPGACGFLCFLATQPPADPHPHA